MSAQSPHWKPALALAVAGAMATAAVFPYLFALEFALPATLPAPTAVLVVAQSLQAGALVFLLAWAGLRLGAPLGLGAPWLGAWLANRPHSANANWVFASVAGAGTAAAILSAMALFGAPADPATAGPAPAAWKGLLAAPYGAIVEETALRVFLVGSVAWSCVRLGAPRAPAIVFAIALAAILFGVGHLPLAAQAGELTGAVIARVIVYNAIGGIVFGLLYWRRGLEHAMLAHFIADVVLHGLAPLATT